MKLKTKRLVGGLFVFALTGGSIYVFPSGLPQPADLLWIAWVFICITIGFRRLGSPPTRSLVAILTIACAFAVWVIIVSLSNALLAGDGGIAFSALYYVFNTLVFLCVVMLGHADPAWFRGVIRRAVLAAICLVVVMLIVTFDSSGVRQEGSFNNPNQLAYFALLLGCIYVVVVPASELSRPRTLILAAGVLTALGFAASLTAIGALSMVVLAGLLKARRISLYFRLGIASILLAIAGAIVVSSTTYGEHLTKTLSSRFHAIDRKTEDVSSARGYDRILEYPNYVVLGAGERGRWRFGYQHHHELHSTWGTLLFSYGIPGLLLFIGLILILLRGQPAWLAAVFLGPCLYGLTHQGLRTTALWILLGSAAFAAKRSGEQGRPLTKRMASK